jgi:predicted GH43/DUF377 family glycosyl hydrolase
MASSTKKKVNDIKVSSKKKVISSGSKAKTNTKTKRKLQDVNLNKIKKVLVHKNAKKLLSPAKKILRVLSKKKIKPTKKIIKKKILIEKSQQVKLKRVRNNPIISPSNYGWESKATYNPTAFIHDDLIHIIYRAEGEGDISVLGYASTEDGVTIKNRNPYFLYKRFFNAIKTEPKVNYISGINTNGGCEDPRIVKINDTLYMTYTAFDGWGSVRVALTSIPVLDFLRRKWNWKNEVLISPPGEINKNWVLFPEKINGKFAIMHSFYPKILIDYFDDLNELNGKRFIKSNNTRPIDKNRTWDSWFRGVGPAPIKTKDGWLILYHAMDHKNPDRYRMGALILDLNDPTRVIYRSSNPILEPEEHYENHGHKWGVIYSCGAVVKDGELYVYYGGADKHVCVASIELDILLDKIKEDKIIKLKNIKEISSQ